MYQVGDTVLYGIHGVCSIIGLEERKIDRRTVQYYVLQPRDQNGAKFLVPAGNPVAAAKRRPILSREELEALVRSGEVRADAWISDENRRKQYYRELINSGDRAALIRMVATLHRHKAAQAAAGRKFHLCDENFLRDAQRLLSVEFALVLGIAPEQVGEYVVRAMEG